MLTPSISIFSLIGASAMSFILVFLILRAKDFNKRRSDSEIFSLVKITGEN